MRGGLDQWLGLAKFREKLDHQMLRWPLMRRARDHPGFVALSSSCRADLRRERGGVGARAIFWRLCATVCALCVFWSVRATRCVVLSFFVSCSLGVCCSLLALRLASSWGEIMRRACSGAVCPQGQVAGRSNDFNF